MKKLNIGQRMEIQDDMPIVGFDKEKPITLKKGTVLFTRADKKFFSMIDGKILKINQDEFEVTNGFSVTGLAAWIYNHLCCEFDIDEMLEERADYEDTGLPQQVEAFMACIGNALEELGLYDYTGNTT